jgi:hypothetical protein
MVRKSDVQALSTAARREVSCLQQIRFVLSHSWVVETVATCTQPLKTASGKISHNVLGQSPFRSYPQVGHYAECVLVRNTSAADNLKFVLNGICVGILYLCRYIVLV